MNNQNVSSSFGIPNNDLNAILSVITKFEKIEKVVLFGSRAKGNYKKGSDIDLALFSKKLSFKELLKIKVDVNNLPLPYIIDILHFQQITNFELKEHIDRIGIVLYQK